MPARDLARSLCPPALWNLGRRLLHPAPAAPAPAPARPEDVELQRLRALPFKTPTTSSLIAPGFQVNDARAFAHLYREVFLKESFKFTPAPGPARILDCGANVGVTVHYWKRLLPEASILAFEADPEIARLLAHNCRNLPGVEVVGAAVWTQPGRLSFAADGSVGGRLESLSQTPVDRGVVEVPTVRLRDYLEEPVELLKMDIEGAELEVIADCADRLDRVRRLFVEYHSFADQPQRLPGFLAVLERAGFRMHIHTELPAPQPFLERPVVNGKDLRLAIYAVRD